MLKSLLKSKSSSTKAPPPKPPVVEEEADASDSKDTVSARGLPSLFQRGMLLPKERHQLLESALHQGLSFFKEFNEARLKLAFDNFTEDMKKALYETLYFLHVNDPKYTEVKFTGIEVEHIYGITKEHEYEAKACLYVEGAPHGIQGIEELPELFREDFLTYIESTFGHRPSAADVSGFCPFVSISSLGSVGTIAHKPTSSDLDMQVQYEMEPFEINTSDWDDEKLTQALKSQLQGMMQRICRMKKIPPAKLKDSAIKNEVQKNARAQIQKSFPNLVKYLIDRRADYNNDLKSPKGQQIRQMIMIEMMNLIKRTMARENSQNLKEREELLRKKAFLVQEYVQKKFPHAEVYLFICDNPSFRKGYHGTTLESKEASGSAYEMILTYEVLMPGIQFTPMIPSHFIVPKMINDDQTLYDRTIDFIRFGAIEMYRPYAKLFCNLGNTPLLKLEYVLSHGGMVYWEAFKAASGNLPKALLNLFRIEMLHNPKYLPTIIEIIKEPKILDKFIDKDPADKGEKDYGLRPYQLLEMEEEDPILLKDPWWTKYKILKVAFSELPYLEVTQRKRISRIIDLCFGMHVKVSAVFTKPGDTRKFESYRDRNLVKFLKRAFPPETPQRILLEHLNIGETSAVIQFENELRDLFKASLDRILNIQQRVGIPDGSNQSEFEIWYHYYQKNFEPPENMLKRSILVHLKVPRLRLQANFDRTSGKWGFRSMQTESKLGKRFDTFGHLDHLPDEVDLMTVNSLAEGIADCVLNCYYGYVDKGKLLEKKTGIEFDASTARYGDKIDQELAYVRPNEAARLADRITEFFVYRKYHYLDCVTVPKHYLELFFMMNLMRFGRLTILYRDNLTNWYMEEFDIKEVKNDSGKVQADYKRAFKSTAFQKTLIAFIKKHNIDLSDEKVKTQFWYNPNSAETKHAANKIIQKEDDIAEDFKKYVYHICKSVPQ